MMAVREGAKFDRAAQNKSSPDDDAINNDISRNHRNVNVRSAKITIQRTKTVITTATTTKKLTIKMKMKIARMKKFQR